MKLKEQIQSDATKALKEKDELRTSALRMLLSAINNKEIEKKKKEEGLTEEEVVEVVSSELKKRKDAEKQFRDAGRTDLADKEKKEQEILSGYMPEQMSEEEVRKLAEGAVKKVGAETQSDFGKVMGALMPQVKGKADGEMVSRVVRELLGENE